MFHCCGDLTLTITDSAVNGNTGADQGGGVFFCCGDDPGTATTIDITRSTIDGNTSADQGGGLFYCCGGGAADTITITDSSVSNNTIEGAGEGGGVFLCCEATGGTTLTMSGSTIAGNTATDGEGGGISTDSATIITNSTISGNTSSTEGGGIELAGGALTLNNVTVTGNTASDGGGVLENADDSTANNSIIALNTPNDCGGSAIVNPSSFNIDSDGTCAFSGSGNQTIDPLLGSLADNGGPTQTHALLAGSPAIDSGNPAAPGGGGDTCESTDQRGVARPFDGDQDGTAVCDVGAYEAGDFDNDGVLDTVDACITDPEDADGFEDSDGCPEAGPAQAQATPTPTPTVPAELPETGDQPPAGPGWPIALTLAIAVLALAVSGGTLIAVRRRL